jgi:hypothetical protein
LLTECEDVVLHNVNRGQEESELNDRLKFFWAALESICGAANFSNTLKYGKKNQKKSALSNLFKTLEECGLSKHRPIGHEVLLCHQITAHHSLYSSERAFINCNRFLTSSAEMSWLH